MPYLLLSRECTVIELDEEILVICEPRPGVSAGSCVAISVDPNNPLVHWRQTLLPFQVTEYEGRTVKVYEDPPPGLYEAHSTLRSGKAQTVYFEVTESREIEIIGNQGDEELVIAKLNGLSLDELHDAREPEREADGLPPLEGTFKQREWAVKIRPKLIQTAERAGDRVLAERIRGVRDSTWFIANRARPLDDLIARIPDPVR